jgi:hypothetical protein
MWGEILGGVLSSYLQSEASQDAAQTQANSGNAANAQTWQMYQQNRSDMMPWRQTGVAALGKLNNYMGLGEAPKGMNPVQAAGAANSKGGQDTILAHINPQEADLLKSMGGSGRVDPVTGGVHFEDNDEGGGGDMGGWDGSDRNEGAGNNRSGWNDPENPGYLRGATPGYGVSVPSRVSGGSIGRGLLGAGAGLLLGGPGLASAGWKAGYQSGAGQTVSGLGNTAGFNGLGGRTSGRMGDIERDRIGGNRGGSGLNYPQIPIENPITPGQIPTENPITAPGTGGTSSFGDFDRNFTMADYQADPGYQFRLNQGSQALERSAAARGGLNSGALGKALTQYGQEMGSQEYGNAYNRWNNDIGNRFNRLSTLAGMGQSATGQVGAYGTNAANSIGNNLTDIGNAQASGQIGSANAWANGINGALNAWNQWNAMNGGGW